LSSPPPSLPAPPSATEILVGIGRAGLETGGQNPAGWSSDGVLGLGFFNFRPLPKNGLPRANAPSVNQRGLWHAVINSLRQTMAPPVNALAAAIRSSPLLLLTVGIQARADDLKAIKRDYDNVKPDGLCGFRSAYRAYLRSLGRPDGDPDLTDPIQRANFIHWLEIRHASFITPRPEIATKIREAIDWIPSDQGYGGSRRDPCFPKQHWFGFSYFAENEGPSSGNASDVSDGASFAGPTTPIIAVHLAGSSTGSLAVSLRRNNTPTEVLSDFALAHPASYDYLARGLGPTKALVFYDESHFWLFDRAHLGSTQLDEAVLTLCSALVALVLKHLPSPGEHVLTEGMLPVGAKRRGVRALPASASSTVTDLVSEDDEPAIGRPDLQCPKCGPGTGWTCTDSQTLGTPCTSCSTPGAPTGVVRFHCLCCNDYFCPTCAPSAPADGTALTDSPPIHPTGSHRPIPSVAATITRLPPHQCASSKSRRKQSSPSPEPNNDLKNHKGEDTPSPAPVVDSSTSTTSSPTSTSHRKAASDKFTSPRSTTCKVCPLNLKQTSHPQDSKWQCEECRIKKRLSYRTGGVSRTCPTCGTHWCGGCASTRSQADSSPPSQRTADHCSRATTVDDPEYLVEKIESHRDKKGRNKAGMGKLEFLIKWSGYDASQNSWEPGESLFSNVIAHAYMRNHEMAHLIDSEFPVIVSPTSALSSAIDGPRTEPSPADSRSPPPALPATTTVTSFVTSPAAGSVPQGEGAPDG
jgi:hypothetical protein